MGKFQFNSREIHFEFPDCDYYIEYTDDLILESRKLAEWANVKTFEGKSERETRDLFNTKAVELIDHILGEGASKEIMQNRKNPTMLDYADVIAYIAEEIRQYPEDQSAKYKKYAKKTQPVKTKK